MHAEEQTVSNKNVIASISVRESNKYLVNIKR